MKLTSIPLKSTGKFSSLFLDHVDQKSQLEPFNGGDYQNISIPDKYTSPYLNRSTLHDVIADQYAELATTSEVKENIKSLLQEESFTVCTGHQLQLCSGPLFFIYKILTTIKLSQQLSSETGRPVVPIFWMASEDHDLEEIQSFRLFKKTLTWETNQTGPVGRMSTEGIKELLSEIKDLPELFTRAYTEYDNLSDATRYFVNELFGKYGLVVLDPDDQRLKELCNPIWSEELDAQITETTVNSTNTRLSELGYKIQVTPRDVNLFLLGDQTRRRIALEKKDDLATVEEAQIADSVDISPNVMLRPVYQQAILPNLAYIGGPGEIAYWLQLKSIHEHFGVHFPALVPRQFLMVINRSAAKTISKTGVKPEDLFKDPRELLRDLTNQEDVMNPLKNEVQKSLEALFEHIGKFSTEHKLSMEQVLKGEQVRANKQFDHLTNRVSKALDQTNADLQKRIETLKENLFPNGGLQERTDNFLNFYINDREFIDKVFEAIDPKDMTFKIAVDE